MRRMTRPRDSLTPAIAPVSFIPQRLHVPLLWSGAVLCAAGFVWNRMWEHWPAGRFLELLVLAAASLALAWPLQRFLRVSWATGIACVWLAALVVFADPLPVLAVALVAITAVVIGGWIAGSGAPIALACACGLALLAGVLGWLLPLPVHYRWSYLALCLLTVGVGHRELFARLREMRAEWSAAVQLQPRAAALGVLALGLASTGCWLPTMQFDDLAYHLGLPWQLMTTGRYALDPTHQVWALAPWASDVQHALPQVMAGAEARGPLNALWIAVTAAGLWQLGARLGLQAAGRWGAIALYASLPLTAGLAAGMQTETATTALLVWLAWLVMRDETNGKASRALLAGAVLAGGLIGLKLLGVVYAGVLVACAAMARRPWPPLVHLLGACVVALAVAGSSYAYAGAVAGNPFLPLFNATFQSPFFASVDYQDMRWHAGASPLLPWNLTFSTSTYGETSPGSAGFILVALSGAWLLSILNRRAWPLALIATVLLALVFLPLQYMRYAFPAMVLLLPVLATTALSTSPKTATWLFAGIALLGFAFQANGNWMQRNGALKQTVMAAGGDPPLFREYAPERLLAETLRDSDTEPVLVLEDEAPAYAEFGTNGRTTAWYAPAVWRAAAAADADTSGAQWEALIRQTAASDVILRRSSLSVAQVAALDRLGAQREAVAGDAELWTIPPEANP